MVVVVVARLEANPNPPEPVQLGALAQGSSTRAPRTMAITLVEGGL